MKPTLVPYLNFDGPVTAEAMNFYKSIFGGELTIQTFGDAGMAQNDEEKNYVMHAVLQTPEVTFMASSGRPGTKIVFGDSVTMSLVGEDEQKLTGWFNKLAVGGKITMKLEKQFWGDVFGMLTDKFGIQWMVNIGTIK